eukprot:TRINITY_DN5047_c0_g1_i1.p1 TRINITY_DN5047_c0_g1~~TRINITY_DN5047_c0_g1_i1.p1  ORF type:complete len:2525 (+),score=559.83 TRINITY_DN5047_c0_g1_i1:101-7675(+)
MRWLCAIAILALLHVAAAQNTLSTSSMPITTPLTNHGCYAVSSSGVVTTGSCPSFLNTMAFMYTANGTSAGFYSSAFNCTGTVATSTSIGEQYGFTQTANTMAGLTCSANFPDPTSPIAQAPFQMACAYQGANYVVLLRQFWPTSMTGFPNLVANNLYYIGQAQSVYPSCLNTIASPYTMTFSATTGRFMLSEPAGSKIIGYLAPGTSPYSFMLYDIVLIGMTNSVTRSPFAGFIPVMNGVFNNLHTSLNIEALFTVSSAATCAIGFDSFPISATPGTYVSHGCYQISSTNGAYMAPCAAGTPFAATTATLAFTASTGVATITGSNPSFTYTTQLSAWTTTSGNFSVSPSSGYFCLGEYSTIAAVSTGLYLTCTSTTDFSQSFAAAFRMDATSTRTALSSSLFTGQFGCALSCGQSNSLCAATSPFTVSYAQSSYQITLSSSSVTITAYAYSVSGTNIIVDAVALSPTVTGAALFGSSYNFVTPFSTSGAISSPSSTTTQLRMSTSAGCGMVLTTLPPLAPLPSGQFTVLVCVQINSAYLVTATTCPTALSVATVTVASNRQSAFTTAGTVTITLSTGLVLSGAINQNPSTANGYTATVSVSGTYSTNIPVSCTGLFTSSAMASIGSSFEFSCTTAGVQYGYGLRQYMPLGLPGALPNQPYYPFCQCNLGTCPSALTAQTYSVSYNAANNRLSAVQQNGGQVSLVGYVSGANVLDAYITNGANPIGLSTSLAAGTSSFVTGGFSPSTSTSTIILNAAFGSELQQCYFVLSTNAPPVVSSAPMTGTYVRNAGCTLMGSTCQAYLDVVYEIVQTGNGLNLALTPIGNLNAEITDNYVALTGNLSPAGGPITLTVTPPGQSAMSCFGSFSASTGVLSFSCSTISLTASYQCVAGPCFAGLQVQPPNIVSGVWAVSALTCQSSFDPACLAASVLTTSTLNVAQGDMESLYITASPSGGAGVGSLIGYGFVQDNGLVTANVEVAVPGVNIGYICSGGYVPANGNKIALNCYMLTPLLYETTAGNIPPVGFGLDLVCTSGECLTGVIPAPPAQQSFTSGVFQRTSCVQNSIGFFQPFLCMFLDVSYQAVQLSGGLAYLGPHLTETYAFLPRTPFTFASQLAIGFVSFSRSPPIITIQQGGSTVSCTAPQSSTSGNLMLSCGAVSITLTCTAGNCKSGGSGGRGFFGFAQNSGTYAISNGQCYNFAQGSSPFHPIGTTSGWSGNVQILQVERSLIVTPPINGASMISTANQGAPDGFFGGVGVRYGFSSQGTDQILYTTGSISNQTGSLSTFMFTASPSLPSTLLPVQFCTAQITCVAGCNSPPPAPTPGVPNVAGTYTLLNGSTVATFGLGAQYDVVQAGNTIYLLPVVKNLYSTYFTGTWQPASMSWNLTVAAVPVNDFFSYVSTAVFANQQFSVTTSISVAGFVLETTNYQFGCTGGFCQTLIIPAFSYTSGAMGIYTPLFKDPYVGGPIGVGLTQIGANYYFQELFANGQTGFVPVSLNTYGVFAIPAAGLSSAPCIGFAAPQWSSFAIECPASPGNLNVYRCFGGQCLNGVPTGLVVVSAQLSNLGDAVTVQFSGPTLPGSQLQSGACSQWILQPLPGATCTWTGRSTLSIALVAASNIAPGVTLTVAPNGIVSQMSQSVFATGSFVVAAPFAPAIPSAGIYSPSSVALCPTGSLVLLSAASNGGAQPFSSYKWSATGPAGASSAVVTALNNFLLTQTAIATVPTTTTYLSQGTWTFNLAVTSFLGAVSSTASVTVTVVGSTQPSVSVQSPAVVYSNYQSFFTANVIPSSCVAATTSTQYSYSWTIGSSSAVAGIGSSLVVGPNQFAFGVSTAVCVTVSSSNPVTATASCTTVVGTLAQVLVQGGAQYSLSGTGFTLSTPSVPGATYRWACTTTGGRACTWFTSSPTTASITISQMMLLTASQGLYTFTVFLTGAGATASGSTFVELTSVQNVPVLSLMPTPSVVPSNAPVSFSVSASSSPNLNYVWEVRGAFQLSTGSTTPVQQLFLSPNNLPTVVINNQALIPGERYFVYVNATNAAGVQASAFAQFRVSSPPSGGVVTISPSSGSALTTTFTMTAGQWSSLNSPLTYIFGYESVDAFGVHSVVPLSVGQSGTSFQTTLPLSASGVLTVGVLVIDTLGASGYATTTVTLSAPTNPQAAIASRVDTITQAAQAGNLQAAAAGAASVASYLNQQPGTADAATTRQNLLAQLQIAAANTVLTAVAVAQQASTIAQLVAQPSQLTAQSVATATQLLLSSMNSAQAQSGINAVTAQNTLTSVAALLSTGSATGSSAASLVNSIDQIAMNLQNSLACGQSAASVAAANFTIGAQKVYASQLANVAPTGSGATFQFGAAANTLAAAGACLGMQTQTFTSNPYSYATNAASTPLVGSLSGLSFSGVNTNSLSAPVTIILNAVTPPGMSPFCVFFNTTTNSWASNGCEVVTWTATTVTCSCNHLTTFAVSPAPTATSKGYIAGIIFGVIGFGVLVYICVYCIRKRNSEQHTGARRGDGLGQSLLETRQESHML